MAFLKFRQPKDDAALPPAIYVALVDSLFQNFMASFAGTVCAAIAAVLTACTRPTLKTAPLFSIRAPTMASGKSLLADAVAMIATGRSAAVMPQGRDEDEDRKRMLALLRQGVRVAVIDNIERDFGSASLCSVLTLERWARPRSLRSRLRQRRGSPPATTPVWLETSPQGWSCAISTPR